MEEKEQNRNDHGSKEQNKSLIMVIIQTDIMKSIEEVEFEQMANTMDKEFEIMQNEQSGRRLREEEMSQSKRKIKNLQAVLNKVEENLRRGMKEKKTNEFDIRAKLRKYKQVFSKLQQRFDAVQVKFFFRQKQQLMKHKNHSKEQLDIIKRAEALEERVIGVERVAEQTHGIAKGTVAEVGRQGKKLDEMEQVFHEIDHELTLAQQLTKVITNREMISKLILVVLVIFLGIANVMVLILKII